jgi:hypothetical protein
VARAGRAAYRKAVVAAPRRLKQLGGGFDGVVWIGRPLGVELHHDRLDHVPVRPALDPPVQFLQLLELKVDFDRAARRAIGDRREPAEVSWLPLSPAPIRRLSSTEARAGERLDPAFAWRRWAGREQIGDLLGRQAGARHPALASSRSIRPFA